MTAPGKYKDAIEAGTKPSSDGELGEVRSTPALVRARTDDKSEIEDEVPSQRPRPCSSRAS
jgi:hypothetical protein